MARASKGAMATESESRRRKEKALADLRELEVGEKKGKLVAKAEVQSFWSERCANIRDAFLNMPDRLAARLAGKHEAEIRVALRDEIEEALRSLHAEAQR